MKSLVKTIFYLIQPISVTRIDHIHAYANLCVISNKIIIIIIILFFLSEALYIGLFYEYWIKILLLLKKKFKKNIIIIIIIIIIISKWPPWEVENYVCLNSNKT